MVEVRVFALGQKTPIEWIYIGLVPVLSLIALILPNPISWSLILVLFIVGTVSLVINLIPSPKKQSLNLKNSSVVPNFNIIDIPSNILDTENSLHYFNSQLGQTIYTVTNLNADSTQIQNNVQDMSFQVNQSASALEEINATISSINNQIQRQKGLVDQVTAGIKEMSGSISHVNQVSEKESKMVLELLKRTNDGSNQVSTTRRFMNDVAKSVEAVAEQIQVIHDIAAQTNLLAMNAAIEAAHAGDKGKGFAVVATEVRKLSENTESNAKIIAITLSELLKKMQNAQLATSETIQAFTDISGGVQSVSEAFGIITESMKSLNNISSQTLQSVNSLSQLSSEISIGAEETKISSNMVTNNLLEANAKVQSTSMKLSETFKTLLNLNQTFSDLTKVTIQSNQNIKRMLDVINFISPADEQNVRQASQRVNLSVLILHHLNWLVRARVYLMGQEVIDTKVLRDHHACDLGKWLDSEAKNVITEPEVYERLYKVHQEIHQTLSELLSEKNKDQDTIERQFKKIVELSTVIVNILSAYQQDDSIRWTADLSTKIPIIDRHHQSLFHLINRLYQTMKQDDSTEEAIKQALEDLYDYTDYHFKAEEDAFNHFKYPDCQKHKAQHDALVNKVHQMREQVRSGHKLLTSEVTDFLKSWISNHIKSCDMLYTTFFQQNNFDVDEFLKRREKFLSERHQKYKGLSEARP